MKLNLDVFEGPLDLLLYLIKKNNLEISRVSVAAITEQYLQYLETMKELNIDLASDFLVMAAELAYIKSKTLLPEDPRESEEDDEGDSADALVAKLRQYQLYKSAALALQKRPVLGRDVFKRGSFRDAFAEAEIAQKQNAPRIYKVEIYDLVKAFAEVLKRLPKEERKHVVEAERVSVTDRMYEILGALDKSEHILFSDLFANDAKKIDLVVSFLAILEMVRLKVAHIYQTEAMGPIRLQKRLTAATAFAPVESQKLSDEYR